MTCTTMTREFLYLCKPRSQLDKSEVEFVFD